MKKIFFIVALVALSLSIQAQEHITTFLGIPVDGTKKEMIRQLKKKGFSVLDRKEGYMEGIFNGTASYIYIYTYNEKVCSIGVAYKNIYTEHEIKAVYNNLCMQFLTNERYYKKTLDLDAYTIPDEEDLYYGLYIKDSLYRAQFAQLPEGVKYSELMSPSKPREEIIEDEILVLVSQLYNNVWVAVSKSGRYGYTILFYYKNGYNQNDGGDL